MKKKLNLKSPCQVYIDWANVYGWTKSLKKEIDPKKLFKYLKSYEVLFSLLATVILSRFINY